MPLSRQRAPVIYLICESLHSFSVLPSTVYSGGQPSDDGLHELAASSGHSSTVTCRLVVSYTTFSPLPNTKRDGGHSLLPLPAVTDSFYFQKWIVLCCPDFPPALSYITDIIHDRENASDRARTLLSSYKITKKAMLSRAASGIRWQTLIINLPGSPKAVRENLEAVLPTLAHGIEILKGDAGECGSL